MRIEKRDVEVYMFLANTVRNIPFAHGMVSPTTVTDQQMIGVRPPNAGEVDHLYRMLAKEAGVVGQDIFT